MSKHNLFRAYNLAKKTGERKRCDRALGLAQRLEQEHKYHTTGSHCDCPDFTYRSIRCKHITALILRRYAEEDPR